MNKRLPRPGGFTLVELAITLVVSAALVVGGLRWLEQVKTNSEFQQAQSQASAARVALLSFATTNHRLPCPDLVGDGLETDCTPGSTSLGTIGWLPVVTLGMSDRSSKADLNRRPRYGVYRTPSVDLAKPVAGVRLQESPFQAFFDAIQTAKSLAPTQQLPYVVAQSSDCGTVQANVAFVILTPSDNESWAPDSATSCFISTDPLASEQLGSLLGVISVKS